MNADQYTPTRDDILGCYAAANWLGVREPERVAAYERYEAAHDAEVARAAKAEALEEAAEKADYEGHLWSGAPSASFFKLADSLRARAAEYRKVATDE